MKLDKMLTPPIKALLIVFLTHATFAADIYVQADSQSAIEDGSSENPFKTIQAAVDAAEASGSGYTFATDTIWVRPGEYRDGGKAWTDAKGEQYSRVYISKKLRLQATGSAADTFIVGEKDDTETGIGPNAVSGVKVTASGTIVRGFTIRDCAAKAENVDIAVRGSAFIAADTGVYFADCMVSNCAGYCTAGKCTAVRCGFFNNYADNGSSRGVVAREANLLYCLMVGNSGTPQQMTSMGIVVNCTVVDNSTETLAGNTSGGYAYNNVLVHAGSATSLSNIAADRQANNIVAAGYHVVSPMTGDFRLASDSPAVNGGDGAYVTKFSVPEELEPTKDYGGKTVATSGTIHCGAIQDVAEVKTGRVKFAADANVGKYGFLDGRQCRLPSYAASAVYPALWRYAGTDGTCRVSHYARTGVPLVASDSVFAETNGTIAVFAPAAGSAVMTVTAQAANATANVLVVDGASKSETEDGTTDNPYKTISAALAACSSHGNLILVRKGTYVGSLTVIYATEIRAVDGPDVTFLDANKGAALTLAAARQLLLSGFTVLNGSAGEVFKGYNGSNPVVVRDCVVSNCTATTALFNYARVIRTKVIGCQSSRYVIDNGRLISSLVGGCTATGGEAPAIFKTNVAAVAFGSTVSANTSPYTMTPMLSAYNSILEGGVAQPSTGCGNLVWALTDTAELPETGFTVGDPMVFNASAGDARMLAQSAARGLAEIPTGAGDLADAFAAYYCSDLSGRDYDFASGTADTGCLQDAFVEGSRVVLTLSDRGGFEVTGLSAGTTVITEPVTVTVSRNYDSDHCCVGVRVNGTLVPFDENDTWTMTLTKDSGAVSLAVADYSTCWYVDANIVQEQGKAYDGMTWARAFKTLKQAAENAKLVANDTVYMAEGAYDADRMGKPVTDNKVEYTSYSRVVIPPNVTFEGAGDRTKTLIVGEPDPTTKGMGAEAVRGVYLSEKSVIRNVTITNGYTQAEGNNLRGTGGGVWAENSKGGTVEDCIITDCSAVRGGGLEFGIARRTLFTRLVVTGGLGCAGALNSLLENCVFDGNDHGCVLHAPTMVRNCTFLNATCDAVRGYHAGGEDTNAYQVCNSYLGVSGKNWCAGYHRCAFAVEESEASKLVCFDDCLFGVPEGQLGADYAPLKTSVLTDAALTRLYPATAGATDFLGTPRVLNDNKLDIGAVEYDWRKDYSADLGRRVTVTDVAPGAKETEAKTVALADGDTLVATVLIKPNEDPAFDWPIAVTDGRLTIRRNGEVLATLESGTTSWKYVAEAATEELAFAYSGTGAATLGRKPGNVGVMLIVR